MRSYSGDAAGLSESAGHWKCKEAARAGVTAWKLPGNRGWGTGVAKMMRPRMRWLPRSLVSAYGGYAVVYLVGRFGSVTTYSAVRSIVQFGGGSLWKAVSSTRCWSGTTPA